ncbi:cob(I)yrinic acid a,c-diamide adenosyltransferase [candidate division WOR-3 bacterium]|nr:cob(I)yrinic acid a,c-diamide adenosyltransferase [candidate division WOR-3 bacterium]
MSNRNTSNKKKSIVTGKGDTGYTYTRSGEKVRKDDIRIEVSGTIDELSSFIGLAKSILKGQNSKDILKKIQKDLLVLGTRISGETPKESKEKIERKHIQYLEKIINELEKELKFENFVLTGDDLASSSLHILHTITRRLERRVVTLTDETKFDDKNVLIYLNRLSDLFFLLACKCSCKEIIKNKRL